jgi:hypothetical protein
MESACRQSEDRWLKIAWNYNQRAKSDRKTKKRVLRKICGIKKK